MIKNYILEWKPFLDSNIILNVDTFLSNLDLNFLGYGNTCISFTDNNKIVYKMCFKNDTCLSSADAFMQHVNNLIKGEVKILPPIDIIYEDTYFLVYTQHYCDLIDDINSNNLWRILKHIRQMFVSKYRLQDIYYRNFGIYKNEIVIFDYHDSVDFYSKDYFYITHLAHMFSLYYYKCLYKNLFADIDDIAQDEFGKSYFPNEEISELLKNLYEQNFDKSIQCFDSLISTISNDMIFHLNNYQYVSIDNGGILNLHKHTLEKFNLVEIMLNQKFEFNTIIDCGCSIGGIGIKIAQLYPDVNILLNNIDIQEIRSATSIYQQLCLINVNTSTDNIIDNVCSYDCTLFFAIIHHLLKNYNFDYVINKIYNMTNFYSIIEIPFKGDILLNNVIQNSVTDYEYSYKYLENVDTFMNAISKYFNVLFYKKIDYQNDNLIRYGFVLKKI